MHTPKPRVPVIVVERVHDAPQELPVSDDAIYDLADESFVVPTAQLQLADAVIHMCIQSHLGWVERLVDVLHCVQQLFRPHRLGPTPTVLIHGIHGGSPRASCGLR